MIQLTPTGSLCTPSDRSLEAFAGKDPFSRFPETPKMHQSLEPSNPVPFRMAKESLLRDEPLAKSDSDWAFGSYVTGLYHPEALVAQACRA